MEPLYWVYDGHPWDIQKCPDWWGVHISGVVSYTHSYSWDPQVMLWKYVIVHRHHWISIWGGRAIIGIQSAWLSTYIQRMVQEHSILSSPCYYYILLLMKFPDSHWLSLVIVYHNNHSWHSDCWQHACIADEPVMVDDWTPHLSEERRRTRLAINCWTHIFLLLSRHELNFDPYVASLPIAEVQWEWIDVEHVPDVQLNAFVQREHAYSITIKVDQAN